MALNYAGRFDTKLSLDGPHLLDGNVHTETISAHASHAPPGAIIVPDAALLFGADFKRSGFDLVLSKDEQQHVLHDYFRGDKHAPVASPDGAYLTSDIIDALTGHVQYAQADGTASASQVIGHVTKLSGDATVIRNGVSIVLNMGDNVEKGDVVQSGANSTLGITFIDGTVFGLASNARMVLNEMVYDPNGSNNSTLFSLVAGTISFVAGQTAKHGDMKIDTPVATMGIRGTAVLVEIDFVVPLPNLAPAQSPAIVPVPTASFQVLVEPDGTTGNYILFDKTTLMPLMTVNEAGKVVSISNGIVSVGQALLSPEVQKLISDVFSLKFTDTSPKDLLKFTDSIVPQELKPFQLADGTAVIMTFLINPATDPTPPPKPGGPPSPDRIPGPPEVVIVDATNTPAKNFFITEQAGHTGDTVNFDTVTGTIRWTDLNKGDVPTASTSFQSFVYKDAGGNDVTAGLNAEQLADIAAIDINLQLVPNPGNNNNGSAVFTYSFPDSKFDFLAEGEKITLTYMVEVQNNFAPNNEKTFIPITFTITGTNDTPTIAATSDSFTELTGTGNATSDHAGGTISFTDVDLTDRPQVTTAFDSFTYTDASHNPLTLTVEQQADIAAVEASLTLTPDPTNTDNGSVTWSYDVTDSKFDFLAEGEILTLTYTATVDDGHGGLVTKPITITITGTNDTPTIAATSGSINEFTGDTDSPAIDHAEGTITFTDVDLTDHPQVTTAFESFTYTDASHNPLTLTAEQQADIAAVEASLTLTPDLANANDGSVTWSYDVEDFKFDFLATGEILTLTYIATVDDGHGGKVTQPITITITGTEDVPPTIATTNDSFAELAETAGSPTADHASGTVTFTDVDLTDRPEVTTAFDSYTYTDAANQPLVLTDEQKAAVLAVEAVLTLAPDPANANNGTVAWSYAVADSKFDFLADGEILTLTYIATVDDGHGGVVTKPITVTITGADDAPVVSVTNPLAVTEGDTGTPDPVTVTVADLVTITDVDLSDVHTPYVTATLAFDAADSTGPAPSGETLADLFTIDPATGTISYDRAAFDYLAEGEQVTATFAFDTASGPDTVPKTVTITINGANDAATIGDPTSASVTEGVGVDDSGNLVATGAISVLDPDHDQSSFQTIVTAADGDLGDLVLNADGTYTYTVSNLAAQYLAEGESKTDTFTITSLDGTTKDVSFTINGADDQAPTVVGDMAITTVKGSGVTLTTLDLSAIDPDSSSDQLVYTVTEVTHGHMVLGTDSANQTQLAVGSTFTLQDIESGLVSFVADDPAYVGQGIIKLSLSDGVEGVATPTAIVSVTIVDAQLTVLTQTGFDFESENPIAAMGAGTVVPDAQHPDTAFKIVNVSANRDFIFSGTGFEYDPLTHALIAGTITSILETTDDASHTPLASFALDISAVDWLNAAIAKANGDSSLIEAVTKPWSINFIGGGGPDSFDSAHANDIFTGGAGDDVFNGEDGYDRASYTHASGPIDVQLAAGIVAGTGLGQSGVGVDTLHSIEMVTGTAYDDTFDATGFSAASANAGSIITANTEGFFNEFEGRGGNDTITGNGATRISYYHATAGVTVTFDSHSWDGVLTPDAPGNFNPFGGASGTVVGDISVGIDTFTGVNSVRGSNFDDFFYGSDNPVNTSENFEGAGGDDWIDGKGGFDRASYNLTSDGIGIDVELAAGTVTDRAGGTDVGTDTLRSIEAIWGTAFSDIYDASGFTTTATVGDPNAGSAGANGVGNAFNEFEGGGGDDLITGNGNTRVSYLHATAGVVVTLTAGGAGTADGDASVGHDTFFGGVNAVRGSEFDDVITGNVSNNSLESLNGNDILDGGGGNDRLLGGLGADTFVYRAGYGITTIADFSHADGDQIDLGTFADIHSINDLTFSISGSTLTITSAGNFSGPGHEIVIQGYDAVNNPVTAGDFIFSLTVSAGATSEISGSSSQAVTFGGTTGMLLLDDPADFSGVIYGFTGAGTLAGSDQIDLAGIDYSSLTWNFDDATQTLQIGDGLHSALLHFNGSYQAANFSFVTDGNGGTIVYDPPVSGPWEITSTTVPVSGASPEVGQPSPDTDSSVGSGDNSRLNGLIVQDAGSGNAWSGFGSEDHFTFKFDAAGAFSAPPSDPVSWFHLDGTSSPAPTLLEAELIDLQLQPPPVLGNDLSTIAGLLKAQSHDFHFT